MNQEQEWHPATTPPKPKDFEPTGYIEVRLNRMKFEVQNSDSMNWEGNPGAIWRRVKPAATGEPYCDKCGGHHNVGNPCGKPPPATVDDRPSKRPSIEHGEDYLPDRPAPDSAEWTADMVKIRCHGGDWQFCADSINAAINAEREQIEMLHRQRQAAERQRDSVIRQADANQQQLAAAVEAATEAIEVLNSNHWGTQESTERAEAIRCRTILRKIVPLAKIREGNEQK